MELTSITEATRGNCRAVSSPAGHTDMLDRDAETEKAKGKRRILQEPPGLNGNWGGEGEPAGNDCSGFPGGNKCRTTIDS